jgi:DDE superfamily endonuclease
MVRLYGRAPRGRRLKACAPHGHWMTTTFVGALRCDAIAAPCVFDGPMNGACFLAYVEHFLAPTLQKGDLVVMDNLSAIKSPASGRQSSAPARACAICRPIAPTSIQSNKHSPSSKHRCERPPREHSKTSSKLSLRRSLTSKSKNAQITSQIQDIATHRENALAIGRILERIFGRVYRPFRPQL